MFSVTRKKIISRRKLAALLKLKRRGKTVVFTNGCFDLVHAGHVAVLEKARALGDVLIVGLNADGSVRGLKGEGRPIVNEKNRALLLAALACVDYVTLFSEPTPRETIALLRPDVLVKGGDYKPSEIVGREFVKKVARVPLVKGLSTSAIVEKIRSHGI